MEGHLHNDIVLRVKHKTLFKSDLGGFTKKNKAELANGGQVMFIQAGCQGREIREEQKGQRKEEESGTGITCHRVRRVAS